MNVLRLPVLMVAIACLVHASIAAAETADAGVGADGGSPMEAVQPPPIPMPMPVPAVSDGGVAPVVAPPEAEPVVRGRSKSLKVTVGIPPTASDLGSEADMVSTSGGDDDATIS